MDFHNDKRIELSHKNRLSYSDRACRNTHSRRLGNKFIGDMNTFSRRMVYLSKVLSKQSD